MSALEKVLALSRGEAMPSDDLLELAWSKAARDASAVARKNKHGVDTSAIKPGDTIHTEEYRMGRGRSNDPVVPAGRYKVAATHSKAQHDAGHVVALGPETKKPKNYPAGQVFLGGGGLSVPLDKIKKHTLAGSHGKAASGVLDNSFSFRGRYK